MTYDARMVPAPPPPVEIRRLAARDSFETITDLLHRAYQPVADGGVVFGSATQDAETTARRAAQGQCFVAESRGRIVGTITVCGADDPAVAPWAADVASFRDRHTAHFHQFAVDPGAQGRGLGRRLVGACEQWAAENGYKRMSFQIAEHATALRALHERLGYVEITRLRGDGSREHARVIMEKSLDRSPLREQLRTLARYNLWATRSLYRRLDELPDEIYRRPAGLSYGSVHATLNHLLVCEHEIWFRRFAENVNPEMALDAELESDRHQLRERLIDGALHWLPLIEVWPESRLLGQLEYRRVRDGGAISLPFAAALVHVFNHGTHHRGQITAALTMMGQPSIDLGLVFMLQEESRQD